MLRLSLEKILNRLIDTSGIDIETLEGKKINLGLAELNMEITFVFTNSRVFVIKSKEVDNVDVAIKLNKDAFLSLLGGTSLDELLDNEEVIVNGNVKVAKKLSEMLAISSQDIEEAISHYTGDIVAHQIGKAVRLTKDKIASSTTSPIESIKDELSTILIAPSRSHFISKKAL